MTWSYTVSDLPTSGKDQVRLLIGDTLTADQQLQDEEIGYLLTTRSSVYGTAAECCRSLQAKFSRSVDQAAGDSKTRYSQMAQAYGVKAAEFEVKAAVAGGNLPYAGGMSIADKILQEQDSDRVPPQFQIGMDDDYLPVAPAGNESDV